MNAEVHTLTGAYAVHALDEFDRRRFEAHLAECPDCAQEVEELRATAARLGAAVSEAPPDHLRRQVLARITTTRQEAPLRRAAGVGAPRPWALRLVTAAAVVALAAAAGLGAWAWHSEHQLNAVQSQLAQAQSRYGAVAGILSAPDARMNTANGSGGGTAIVLASHELNRAVLLVSDLPRPPAGHTYQAWLIGSGGVHSAGLLADPAPPLTLAGLTGANKVGVTVEPAGGSPQPTTTPVILFDLPA